MTSFDKNRLDAALEALDDAKTHAEVDVLEELIRKLRNDPKPVAKDPWDFDAPWDLEEEEL